MTAAHDSTRVIDLPLEDQPGKEKQGAAPPRRPSRRIRPRLIVPGVAVRCEAGHELRAPAEYVADGHEIFCPTCRRSFRAGLEAVGAAQREAAVGLPRRGLRDVQVRVLRHQQEKEREREAAGALAAAPGDASAIAGSERPRAPAPASTPAPVPTPAPRTSDAAEREPGRAESGAVVKISPRAFRRLLSASTWTISCALHAAVLLALIILGVRAEIRREEPEVLLIAPIEAPQKPAVEEPRLRDLFTAETKTNEAEPRPVLADVPRPEAVSSETEALVEPTPPGAPDALIADMPVDLPAGLIKSPLAARTGPIGVGGAPGAGGSAGGGALQLRGTAEGRLAAAEKGGGGRDTESAVERALAWLAAHQDEDGSWSATGFYAAEPAQTVRKTVRTAAGAVEVEVPVAARRFNAKGDAAHTGFAVLAFLGAGYTHRGSHAHSERVRRGLAWLIKAQDAGGSFGGCNYTQGIATMALAEACGMAGLGGSAGAGDSGRIDDFDAGLRTAAQKGVDCCVKSQIPYLGWDYNHESSASRAAGIQRWGGSRTISDTSVTVWNCLALKSSRIAGLRVDGNAFNGIVNWLDRAQSMNVGKGSGSQWAGGRFAYRDGGAGAYGSNTMVAAGLTMRLYTGTRPDDRHAFGPANLLLGFLPPEDFKEPTAEEIRKKADEIHDGYVKGYGARYDSLPDAAKQSLRDMAESAARTQLRGGNPEISNVYFLYHSTVPMFQMGGDYWKRWNPAMKRELLATQVAGGEDDGSWPPGGHASGRTMATALGAMTLEVYYRYLRLYDR